jgi:hypothetical protein
VGWRFRDNRSKGEKGLIYEITRDSRARFFVLGEGRTDRMARRKLKKTHAVLTRDMTMVCFILRCCHSLSALKNYGL